MAVPYLSEDNKEVFCCGVPVVITENPEGGILVTWKDGELSAPENIKVWGGCYTLGSDPIDLVSTSITVNSGKISGVFGSNKGPGTIDKVTLIINDGTIANAAGGIGKGNSVVPGWEIDSPDVCHLKETHVTFNGGKVNILYAGTGSGIALVDKTYFTMTGGEAVYAIGGNSNGEVKEVNMNISGGKVTFDLCAANRGTCGDINMKVTGGEFALISVSGDAGSNITGKTEVGIYGGKVDKFAIYEDKEITQETNMENMDISYYPGVLNKEDIANAPVEIKEDATKGEGAKMKTIRIYPFPHKSDRIFGVLTEGKAIEMPAELPMSEQEIRMCLGMGHLFEVIDGKLVVLDEHNYNEDNSEAAEFTGVLPCDDCEISYPREEVKEEELEAVAVYAMPKKKTAKKSTYVAPADIEEKVEAVKPAVEPKKEETVKVEEVKEK